MSLVPSQELAPIAAGVRAGTAGKRGAIPRRWLRIIPTALAMYTIDFVARSNISLMFNRRISTLPQDLGMDDRMIGAAAGVFSIGYFLLQLPGGYFAQRWSPKKFISWCLVGWTVCAMSCGLAQSFGQLAAARFLLGLSEAGVFPAAVVLLSHWFPARERVRATAFFLVSQPLAVAVAAPVTGWWLGAYGWRATLLIEGTLPVFLLPLWWCCIADHPRDAKWLPPEECAFIEQTVAKEVTALEPKRPVGLWRLLLRWDVLGLIAICFLQTCFISGLMPFFTATLAGQKFTSLGYGFLFAVPYLLAAPAMLLVSWHSDHTQERRFHLAAPMCFAGSALILSVLTRSHFSPSYALMSCAIAAPFSAFGAFYAIPAETFPRVFLGVLIGTVNSIGNLGGFVGPYFVGWLADIYHSVSPPFICLGAGLLIAAVVAVCLSQAKPFGLPAASRPGSPLA